MNNTELWEKYLALGHAIQSAVAYKMNKGSSETSPKHLRVGVNMAMVTQDAFYQLLLKKGVFTENEYLEAMVVAAQKELTTYEEELGFPAGTFV